MGRGPRLPNPAKRAPAPEIRIVPVRLTRAENDALIAYAATQGRPRSVIAAEIIRKLLVAGGYLK